MSIGDLIVCPATHAVKTYTDGVGTWTRGTDNVWFQYVQGNGGKKYRFRCLLCGRKSGDVPHDLIKQWIREGVIGARDLAPPVTRAPRTYPDCSYAGCTATITEQHHFAPRNTFGSDADSWPVLPLCREHHTQWHQRMDGYRWHMRGAA